MTRGQKNHAEDRIMIEIKELLMRIPNLSSEEGRYIGEQVSRRIAENLSGNSGSRYIDGLDLKLTLPGNASRGELVARISDAILGKIDHGPPPDASTDVSGPASWSKQRQEKAS